MEYDGATTTCEDALEHEVFHSWFGRGVKPASAADGWIDEAMASWATASRNSSTPRYAADELSLDGPPTLLCPGHPWSRHTPREAYAGGSRLLSGVAHRMGGAGALRAALAGWYREHVGGFATTAQLAEHLERWSGLELGPWWDRYVYGRDG
jgi:aminopeptidase N